MTPLSSLNTRDLVPILATRMVRARELPNANSVSRLITAETGIKPSTTTVHDELTRWFSAVFWPTIEVLYPPASREEPAGSDLPIVDPDVQRAIDALHNDGFRQLVVAALEIGAARFVVDRAMMEATLNAKAAALEAQRLELAKAVEDLESAHKALGESAGVIVDLREQLIAREAAVGEAEEALAQLRRQSEVAQAAWTALETGLTKTIDDNRARYVAELHALQVDLDGHRQDARKAAERSDSERARAETSQARNETLVAELAEARARLGVVESQLAALRVKKASPLVPRVVHRPFRVLDPD